AFQTGRAALVGEAGRVVAARVFEALVLAGAGLGVGGSRVDGRHDRAGAGVGRLAGVDGAGTRSPVLRVFVGAAAMVRHGRGIPVKANREFYHLAQPGPGPADRRSGAAWVPDSGNAPAQIVQQ